MKRKNRRRRKARSIDLGNGDSAAMLGTTGVMLPDGYSPEELEEEIKDPQSKIRRAIDEMSAVSTTGITDPALANWTYVLSSLAKVSADKLLDPITNVPALKSMKRQLGAARVIDIPGNIYVDLFHNIDVYTCEEVGGASWIAPRPEDMSKEERNASIAGNKKILEAHDKLEYPSRFPFERTYFAFTSPAPWVGGSASYAYRMNKLRATDRAMGRPDDGSRPRMRALGILACANGLAVEFMELFYEDGSRSVVPFEIHWPSSEPGAPSESLGKVGNCDHPMESRWANNFLLNGWMVRALVDLVNNYRSIVVTEHSPTFSQRHQIKRRMKKIRSNAIPKPFYRVRLHTSVTHKSWKQTQRTLKQETREAQRRSYRHDVRGHERCHIERGIKPLAPELRDKLLARGFSVYINAVDPSDLIRMSARGIREKSCNEWIAIRHKFIADHISPRDESLPYIPSIHEVPPSSLN